MSATGEASPASAESGATLLEMLVVLGLLLMATGLIFPNLRRPYAALSVEAARAAVAADLRSARAEAVRTGQPVDFDISADGRSYGYDGGRTRLPAAVRLVADPGAIVFGPDGSSPHARLAVVQDGRRPLGLDLAAPSGVVAEASP